MNPIPDEKQIEEMLERIAPAQVGHLEQRLANAPWTARGIARRRLINTALVTGLVVVLLIAATPQGQALAQSILQFFVRTESDTRPVPTLVSQAAVSNTLDEELTGSFPDSRLHFEETCGDLLTPHCSLSEIRSMVTFPVMGLQNMQDGLVFQGATGGPQQVALVYTGDNVNGSLTLVQEPVGEDGPPSPQVAASTRVETVFINGITGEYVQGSWFSIDNEDGISWTDNPFVQTLRWETDSMVYSLVFRAGKDTGITLNKDDLLYLAGQLTVEVDARAAIEPLPAMEIEQISEQAGFTVIQPGWLPGEYAFLGAGYIPEQNAACLYFTYASGDAPVLAIAQRPTSGVSILDDISISTVDWNGQTISIPIVTEPVEIGGAEGQGLLISNGVNASKLCPQLGFTANQALYWQRDGKDYIIFGLIDQFQGGVFISKLEMQRLAENLTGISIIPEDQIDPQRLLSVEAASSLAGFDLKTPTQMVAGVQFNHAVHLVGAVSTDRSAGEAEKPAEEVNFIYTPLDESTHAGIDYNFQITQASGWLRPLNEIYAWGGFEYVTINGQTGVYRKMCWDAMTGGTDCRQELYWDENGIGYGFNLYLPGALDKEEFFAIAESMEIKH